VRTYARRDGQNVHLCSAPLLAGGVSDHWTDRMPRFRNYWIYSAGLAVAWLIVFVLIFVLRGAGGASAVAPVFLGFCIGWALFARLR
jgi:hypothetical protein